MTGPQGYRIRYNASMPTEGASTVRKIAKAADKDEKTVVALARFLVDNLGEKML